MDPEIDQAIREEPKNKILVITHDNVMKALTAESIRYNPLKETSIYSPFDFIGAKPFEYCELFPYCLERNSNNQFSYQPSTEEELKMLQKQLVKEEKMARDRKIIEDHRNTHIKNIQ